MPSLIKEELMRRTHHLNILVAILLVVGLLAPSTAIALSSSTTIKLWIGNASMSVNGVQQLIDVQGTKPVIVAGRTLVPIRAVIEAFGGSAAWESSTRKATVMLGKDSLDLWIGKSQASLNGIALAIDAANSAVVPVITNGRTMLPLRFVAESLGIDVQYDATTKMITLTYSIKEIVVPPVTYVLTVITVGNGIVTPATGTTYAYGTVVTLTATPAAGYTFTGWSGDLSGTTNPTTITMDAAKAVAATFAITPPVVAGYSYSNPAPLNTVQTVTGQSPLAYGQTYTAEMSVKEIIRGGAAWSRLQAANMFNSQAPEGYEYILARIYFKVLDVTEGQTFDLSHTEISLISADGKEYDSTFGCVTPDPQLDAHLYKGASSEGWDAFIVKKDDAMPKLAFGRKSDGTGGIWFKAY
jgi:uncharacterized repeat protein (TIGR02543 family)